MLLKKNLTFLTPVKMDHPNTGVFLEFLWVAQIPLQNKMVLINNKLIHLD